MFEVALSFCSHDTSRALLTSFMAPSPRTDTHTALVVDLALAISETYGRAAAAQYLHASGVALRIAVRVLNPSRPKRLPEPH